MTEKEAKEKFCPFMRTPFTWDKPNSVNVWRNEDGSLDFACCLGSDCMMWISSMAMTGEDSNKAYGYCGLVK